jgi:hypothetical protein
MTYAPPPIDAPPPAPPSSPSVSRGPFDVVDLLRRAFAIVRTHRSLWLFGILLALTGGTGGMQFGNTGGGGPSSIDVPDFETGPGQGSGPGSPFEGFEGSPGVSPDFDPSQLGEAIAEAMSSFGDELSSWAGWIVLVCCLILALVIVVTVVHYVARVALMRMVEAIERGAAPTWRDGFRLGWSHLAFRLWLLELLVGLAGLMVAVVAFLLLGLPAWWFFFSTDAAFGAKLVIGLMMGLTLVPVFFVVGIVLSIMGRWWSREIALAQRTIGQAFGRAWDRLRSDWRSLGLLWLAVLVISFAGGIGLLVLTAIVALPVLGILLAVWAATSSIGLTMLAAVPLGLLVLAPLVFVGGLLEAFFSTGWTLGWLELAGFEA